MVLLLDFFSISIEGSQRLINTISKMSNSLNFDETSKYSDSLLCVHGHCLNILLFISYKFVR